MLTAIFVLVLILFSFSFAGIFFLLGRKLQQRETEKAATTAASFGMQFLSILSNAIGLDSVARTARFSAADAAENLREELEAVRSGSQAAADRHSNQVRDLVGIVNELACSVNSLKDSRHKDSPHK